MRKENMYMRNSFENHSKNMRFYLLIILVALELLMSFSFLGYVHIEPISITTAYIPVLLAGVLAGLPEAVILGAVFGLSSMWKAGANYVMAADQLFSPFMSGHPAESLMLSVGSRILFGLLVGILYLIAKRVRFTGLWIFVISFFGKFLHSFLVYGFMGIFFSETGYNALSALRGFDINDIVTNIFTGGIILLFWELERSERWRGFCKKIEKIRHLQPEDSYSKWFLAVVILLTLCFAMAVAVYFVNRMNRVLAGSGVVLTDTNYSDLIHLQIQFLIGIISLALLVTIFLILNRKYNTYTNYEARTDALTGILTRKAFFRECESFIRGIDSKEECFGYFIMADVDNFKGINDRFGHPEGDHALRNLAAALQDIFRYEGLTGRVGGDEFAVFVYNPIPREKLERNLELLADRIGKIGTREYRLSCSIGAVPVTGAETAEDLYREADRLMYMAKKHGRDRYVIAEHETTDI